MTGPSKTENPRAWQRMLSGRRLDLLNPDPADIDIVDIAHGLARVARWNGQTIGPHAFTVAQHSLIVAEIADDLAPEWLIKWRRAALLHDAAEYVIGDLISPFKAAVGDEYKDVEKRLMNAIHLRFELPGQLPPNVAATIKSADRIAAYYEATVLAGFSPQEARTYFGTPTVLAGRRQKELEALTPLNTTAAQKTFVSKFHSLGGQ